MMNTRKALCVSALCGCLFAVTAGAQTMIENFDEYADDAALQAAWTPQTATLSLSSYVPAGSTSTNSMQMDIDFPNNAWQTEVINGPMLSAPVSIDNNQYITLEIAGDPQFTNATYQMFFIYAFDENGNFGRWGASIPTVNTNWQVLNIAASSIAVPWNSPGLPDLTDIVQFSFYIYGEGDPPSANPYSATIYVDNLQVRDTPLIQFPAPSPMRALIDNFEEYSNDAALLRFYSYQDSPAATTCTASLLTPAPQGSNALELTIDFAPGQYPWAAVWSPVVAPFSLPTNAVVSLWFQGDPTLAPVMDYGTTFWLSFYDAAGNGINFVSAPDPVISSDWTNLQFSYDEFTSGAIVDTGNLVQWRILVEGWAGTPDSTSLTASFGVDDIQITIPPVLTVVQAAGTLQLHMDDLISGTTYTLRMSPDLTHWTTTTIHATSASAIWPIPSSQQTDFYQLFYTP
jgi:hypothetical protein